MTAEALTRHRPRSRLSRRLNFEYLIEMSVLSDADHTVVAELHPEAELHSAPSISALNLTTPP